MKRISENRIQAEKYIPIGTLKELITKDFRAGVFLCNVCVYCV